MVVVRRALSTRDRSDAMSHHPLDSNARSFFNDTPGLTSVGRRTPERLALAATIVSLTICLASSALAQGSGTARIEGTVHDSVHARPLAGARVVAVGTGAITEVRRDARADSLGRYRIDSLPAGRYAVGLESALLDSLEIVIPPREAVAAPLSSVTVDLAMPSAATLRAAICPGVALSAGTGILYGHVVHAESEGPLVGGQIALQWRDLSFDPRKLRAVKSERATSVPIDSAGWYRACGLPTGGWVSMQVQADGHFGPVLRTRIDDTLGIAIRHLSFSIATASDSGDASDRAMIAPFTGTAALTGIVRGAGGLPVASAEVHVLGARSSGVTDERGSYTLTGLPAGTRDLEVRRIGYAVAEASVDLRSGATVRRDVQMQRITNLDSVVVVATRTRYPEFTEHRKFAVAGKFLGPAEIAQRFHLPQTSDIVRSVGGFIIDNSRGRSRVMSARGVVSANGRGCVANVVIDGLDMGRMDIGALSVDDVSPRDIGAMEIYRPGDMTPADYTSGCGLIVIWTKR